MCIQGFKTGSALKQQKLPQMLMQNSNADITCPHKGSLPEALTGVKRQVVSEEVRQ